MIDPHFDFNSSFNSHMIPTVVKIDWYAINTDHNGVLSYSESVMQPWHASLWLMEPIKLSSCWVGTTSFLTLADCTCFTSVKVWILLAFDVGGCSLQQQSCAVLVCHKSLSSCRLWLLQDGFVVRIYTMSSDPALQQELQLKLARKCLHACGISLFDLEKDLHIISKCLKIWQ